MVHSYRILWTQARSEVHGFTPSIGYRPKHVVHSVALSLIDARMIYSPTSILLVDPTHGLALCRWSPLSALLQRP